MLRCRQNDGTESLALYANFTTLPYVTRVFLCYLTWQGCTIRRPPRSLSVLRFIQSVHSSSHIHTQPSLSLLVVLLHSRFSFGQLLLLLHHKKVISRRFVLAQRSTVVHSVVYMLYDKKTFAMLFVMSLILCEVDRTMDMFPILT